MVGLSAAQQKGCCCITKDAAESSLPSCLQAAVAGTSAADIQCTAAVLTMLQVVVMVEVVPLLRQQTACAVAMLPSSIMGTGHKLKIKATSLESKEGGQKGRK